MQTKKNNPNQQIPAAAPPPVSPSPPARTGNREPMKSAIGTELANARSWVKETLLELKVRNKLLVDISPADALRIHIAIEGQTVILTGAVEKPTNIAIAESLASSVEGVRKVNNQLTCNPDDNKIGAADRALVKGGNAVNDALLETKVMSKLLAKTGLGALKIEVEAVNGEVSLSGMVTDLSHRDEALRITRETGGVKRVNDQMKIAPFDDAVQ